MFDIGSSGISRSFLQMAVLTNFGIIPSPIIDINILAAQLPT